MISGYIFFFKQKTAYEMRISDWSSDVCSSDLRVEQQRTVGPGGLGAQLVAVDELTAERGVVDRQDAGAAAAQAAAGLHAVEVEAAALVAARGRQVGHDAVVPAIRSEEHTSELQSLMRISYAVFCLKKNKTQISNQHT